MALSQSVASELLEAFRAGEGVDLVRESVRVVMQELVGVLTVGTLSIVDPAAFPRATVWSTYGIGYAFVPLVLPVLGLLWLRHTRPTP